MKIKFKIAFKIRQFAIALGNISCSYCIQRCGLDVTKRVKNLGSNRN